MVDMESGRDRREELIDCCLDKLIEKGLYETSVKDLASAAGLNPGALYFHFSSKDEIVLACAEEAGLRIEKILILPVLECVDDTRHYVEMNVGKMADMAPLMKFFAQVCTTSRYREALQPGMERMKRRHREYARRIADQLQCPVEEVAPYLYACVALVSNRMVFGEDLYYVQPFQLIADGIQALRQKYKDNSGSPGIS